ncbi:MAG: F0F1 ATP synthase subunit delta [Actinomycetales bacterium]|nr:F0F1 ATP synthase subunit delta [Actinomycetales bacterium]
MRPPPFRAASEVAVAAAMDRWNAVLETSDELDVLRIDLTRAVDLIDGFPPLRRALTDPSRSGEDKAALVTDVLQEAFHPDVVDLVAGMVRSRWSQEGDLTRALERIHGVTAVARAERRGEIERVADELFQVFRLLGHERRLRNELQGRDDSAERRLQLLDDVFGGYLLPTTMEILRRLITSPRHPSLTSAVLRIAELAAERRNRLIAVVTTAVPLSDQQIERLRGILSRQYDRDVHINVAVDPEVVGGVRVHIGDDLVDRTVAKQLENVRRQVAG